MKIWVALASVCVLCCASGTAVARTEVSLAPFVWAPSIHGTLAQGPVTIPLDASPGDLAGGLRAGGMVHAEVRGPRWQASVQAIALKFHDRQFQPIMGADVATSLLTAEALAGPRINLDPIELVPLAGFRHTRIRGTITAQGLGSLVAAKGWDEGLLGLEARARVTPRLTLRARGTVAVAGPEGQSGADLILAAIYRLSRSVSVVPGYRWAHERVLPGEANSFSLDLNANGPLLGLLIDL